jgi:hypothetical protein
MANGECRMVNGCAEGVEFLWDKLQINNEALLATLSSSAGSVAAFAFAGLPTVIKQYFRWYE